MLAIVRNNSSITGSANEKDKIFVIFSPAFTIKIVPGIIPKKLEIIYFQNEILLIPLI